MGEYSYYIPELRCCFSEYKYFRKTDLRNFYRHKFIDFAEKDFRRILYFLETRKLIIPIDTGIYTLDTQSKNTIKKKFVPVFSSELSAINGKVKKAFPYTNFLLWETQVLHEFMVHQPRQNLFIVETEKEATESIFNYLNDMFVGRIFLKPDQSDIERYVLPQINSVIVVPLITQSPKQTVREITTPKLEKILVDIFTNEEIFYIFQGEELVNIYSTAFTRYLISQKTLFRYAQRRNVSNRIRTFITQKTSIALLDQQKACQ